VGGQGVPRQAELLGEEAAERIITKLEQFAKYSFNKSHSICYAVIGFRTLYAKYYYPAEFIIASIRTIGDDPKKAAKTGWVHQRGAPHGHRGAPARHHEVSA
jgi:DNA polymerase III alpha subunit